MHIVLHLAISKDGYIAKGNGDSGWVSASDEELFKARAKEAGCLVVGKTTYDQYAGKIYPVEGALNIVLTKHTGSRSPHPGVMFAESPEDAISIAERNGFKSLLIAGGAKTSAAFLREGLVEEVFLSEHPIVLGEGIAPFEDFPFNERYELVATKELDEGVLEKRYRAVK